MRLSHARLFRFTLWSTVFVAACLNSSAAMAAAPAALAGSGVATAPADAAFFSSTLRLKEQIDIFMDSNAWAKLRELPAISRGLDSWNEQKDMPGSPVSMFFTFLELPENAQAVELLSDMVAHDTFVYGDPSCAKFLKLVRIVSAAQQEAALRAAGVDEMEEDFEEIELESDDEEISGARGRLRVLPVRREIAEEVEEVDDLEFEVEAIGGEEAQALAMIEAIAKNIELFEVPDIVWGFKTGKKDTAEFQLKRIEVLAKLLAEMSPQAAGAMTRKKVAGGTVLSFTIAGSLVPWDEIAGEIENRIGESEDLEKVLAKARETNIVIGLGVIGDWVILSIGDSLDHLDKLVLPGGKGKALIDTPPFAKLLDHADKPLTGISYLSEELAEAMAPSAHDLDSLIGLAVMGVENSDAADGASEAVKKWLDELNTEYVKQLPEPGPWLSYSFMTPTGYEGYAWSWFKNIPLDGEKPLSLLEHAGGTPIAVAVTRFTSNPDLAMAMGQLVRDGWDIFATYAVPEMSDDEQEKFDTFSEKFLPLAGELATIFTDKFAQSIADGQVGFVIDSKSTTDKLQAELPSSAEPLPVPEFAIVLPLADRKLFVEGLNDFFAWGDKLVATMREVDPNSVPEGYAIPEPSQEKVAGGSVWSFGIPDAGLDEKIAAAIGVGDSAVVFTLVPGHAARLLDPTPLKTGGAVTKFAAPLAAASAVDFPTLIDMIEPWVIYFTRYGCVMEAEGEVDSGARLSADDETAEAAEALTHVRVALEVARCLKTAVSELSTEDDAFVTHWRTVIEDIPAP
jgi:hypothetical protein